VAGELIVDSGKRDGLVIQRFYGYIYGLFRSCENEPVRERDGLSIKMQLDLELRFGREAYGDLARLRLHEVLSETVAEPYRPDV
jgi:hypothetical protein